MKFRIWAVDDTDKTVAPLGAYQEGDSWFIDIADLDQLMALEKAAGESLVIYGSDSQPTITVYNDYME
jgi:hypothetical protein